MNSKVLLMLRLGALGEISCKHFKGNDQQDFLPGTYVSFAEGDYSVAWDTLFVQRISDQDNKYRVSRHTAFISKVKGDSPGKQYAKEVWLGNYDDLRKVLLVQRTGKVISIFPDSSMILLGTRRYEKLGK